MRKILSFFLLLFGITLYGQQYPLVTIQDIQFVPDSILVNGDPPSPLQGDTVRVRGVVLVRPVVDPVNDRRRIVAAGARWHTYIQDENGQVWGGIATLQHDTTGANQGTFFDLVDTAQIVEFTGVVNEFNTTTQFDLLINPAVPVNVVGVLPKRPEPIELNITDFMEGGILKKSAERYEGMYVIIRNVITSDRNTSSGTFKINDGQGNSMFMYDQSGYFTLRGHRLTGLTTYQPPLDGSALTYIRGVIQTRTDGYYITPLYPGDIQVGATPPSISSIRRDVAVVNPSQQVTVTSTIIDLDGRVVSAKIKYRFNNGATNEVVMVKSPSDSTLYSATIPGVSGDSSIVDYYIQAVDDSGKVSTNPADTTRNRYFYLVLNRSLKISDVQYSPYGSGFSGYNGYRVSLSGIVTADTSDLPGFGSTPLRVYMQDGSTPWSGIQLNGISTLQLKRGDMVSLSGVVNENFSVTWLDSLQSVTVSSSNNPLPAPIVISTSTISNLPSGSIAAEKYESVIVEYKNITVTDDNADGNSGTTNNFGEILVADTSNVSTRVELQDGNHMYHNSWDATVMYDPSLVKVKQGDTFQSLKGILYFSFSNYKLVPRKNDDFTGFVSDNSEAGSDVPDKFELNQNYPNPFNPVTSISYTLPKATNVTISIYNALGQLVKLFEQGYQTPGSYKLLFDASTLTSGIYIYQLRAGEFTSSKKMMLIK